MGQTIKLVIPGVPPSLNTFAGRENTWFYRQQKGEWTGLVCYVGRTRRPQKPFKKALVTIIYRFKNRQRHDPDNYSGKFILDGLTEAGIIVDDSFKHIRLLLDAEDEPGEERTTVIIHELQEWSDLHHVWGNIRFD